MEVWRGIPLFPGYSVSDLGRVRNDVYDRILRQSVNQLGIVHVGLAQNKKQTRRSVAVLVAQAFLPKPRRPEFNTPIHLNGDKRDLRAENLMLRALWFAREYHQQFVKPHLKFTIPIMELETGEVFPTSWEAATKYGLLEREIVVATYNRTYVGPTMQYFGLA